MRFEWDAGKAKTNFSKHRVTFQEAQTVFDDPSAWVQFDHEHSRMETRWRIIGFSVRLRLLSVIYTKRNEETIRLITARRASAAESKGYTGEA